MSFTNQIKKATILSYIGLFLNVIVGLLFTPWLIRTIGTSDYALYTLIGVFLSYFIMDFGLSDATVKFVAKYRTENEEKIKKFLGITFKLYLVITAFLSVLFFGVYFFLDAIFLKLTPLEIERFKGIYIIASFFSLFIFPFTPVNGILIAYEKFVVLKVTDIISKIASVLFMIVFLLLGYNIFAIVAISSFVTLSVSLYKAYVIYTQIKIIPDFKYNDKHLLREITHTSGWFTLIAISKRFLINLSPTLLGIFSGSKQIAIFSIAMLLESYVFMFTSSINGFFTSRIATITSKTNDTTEVLALMIKTGRIQLLIVGIIYIGLISVGKDFILLWMGSDFEIAYYIILFMIASGFFTLTQDVANSLMYIKNEIKYRAIFYISSVLVSLVLSVILLPSLGALGAGIAIGVSYFVFHFIAINWVFHKKMNLNIFVFFKEVYGKMGTGLLISLLFSLILNYFVADLTLFNFCLKGSLIVSFYSITMWFLAMNHFEKNLIKNILKF
jgi:O-antigen/teichoic acid export membrane protein